MHHLLFGHSFAVLVALILIPALAFYFLNRKTTTARRYAEHVDSGGSGLTTTPAESNSGESSAPPTETENVASSSSSMETSSVASSSLAAATGNCYEVFLSFRGPDTRHGFTDHLYHGLLSAGIDTFRDDDELCQGEDIRPMLTAAITNSKILIPVLSVTFGTSSWCLDELAQMMELKNEKGRMVLPIFYKVKPADVRYLKGDFGKAFHEHKERMRERSSLDPTILEKWKKALLQVSDLRGYEADGSEVELMKSIVRKVLGELKKKFELVITENLVGIDSHVNKIMEFVYNKSHGPLFVGIHGMGGIGKTTLAKTIYNKLSNRFEYRSFIADIRELSKRNGLPHVQEQFINDLLKQEYRVRNIDEGIIFISSRLKAKKILVLLDDLDDIEQLLGMVVNHDRLSSESIIIITSRSELVLETVGVDYKYELKEMNCDQSLHLFSLHAFRKDYPPSEFEDLSRKVVYITKGLPLSLEVLGSLLCGRELSSWKGIIEKLQKKPPMAVQEKLKISFDQLDYEQKQIFLDIACFFIGADKRIVTYMWDACGFFSKEGIEVLRFMSLIKIENDHDLRMHDQLRDLGREIVRGESRSKPEKLSRLWDSKEAQKVLKESKGTNKIEAINLSEGSWKDRWYIVEQDGDIYTREQFNNMTSLRFLQMTGAHLSGDFKNSMEKLKWLRWKGCPMNFEATNFHVKELVVLELPRSGIDEKWEGWRYFMMAKELKFLDLSDCHYLENTDFLSAFKKLEVLILSECWGLQRIDSSIVDMKSLLRLELRGCRNLIELPVKIGELKALEQLLLQHTEALSALPDSITSLENLEILDISFGGIEELPKDIGRLRKLRELNVASCNNLKGVRLESMHKLASLQRNGFFSRYKLQSLPDLPPSLTYLHITCQCRKLPSLSHLVHLKQLRIWDCRSLECIKELPSALLKTSECSQFTDIEELESPQSPNTPSKLEYLDVTGCGSIKSLDVSEYINLRALYIEYCENLLEVRGIDKLIFLEILRVTNCNSIKQLDLPESKSLYYLYVHDCLNLTEIQGLNRLDFLKIFNIYGCKSLKTNPELLEHRFVEKN